ncbi:twin-arginine translocation signal domain-containing protein [Halosimplex aquaticum]
MSDRFDLPETDFSRRDFLVAAGITGTSALAGCALVYQPHQLPRRERRR